MASKQSYVIPLGVEYDKKLQYGNNIIARQLLTMYMGDDGHQKYDDSNFLEKYKAISVYCVVKPNALALFNFG
jgi:hypothetical protein